MRVAVIDVGSNTARLLVATVTADGRVEPLAQERDYLRLGAEIERTGTLSRRRSQLRENVSGFRSPCDRSRRRSVHGDRHCTRPAERVGGGSDSRSGRIDRLVGSGSPRRARGGLRSTAPLRAPRGRFLPPSQWWISAEAPPRSPSATHARSHLGSLRRSRLASPHAVTPARRSADRPPDPGRPGRRAASALRGLRPPTPALGIAVGGSARALGQDRRPAARRDSLDDAVAHPLPAGLR